MYNVKLKSVPNKAKTGSQLDYSLVDRNTLFLKPNTPVDSDVKNTIGAVSRDKANIEAEGGETIIGDTNNDGFLEHQTIVGKRHTQGGVPLNVPEGSFIFSDTKKMTIKDPEVLAIFGMKPSKAGYTPAEIAKRYNVNEFIAILKDPAKDKYSKETAQIMLQSNLKKLGMLALIQESMKGFPDGVPAIAESIMGQMQGGQGQESPEQEYQEAPEEQAPQEEMQEGEQPMQRYGGTQLPKAQRGKNKIVQVVKHVPEGYDLSPWGDIKRSFNYNVEDIRKNGLINHIQDWWDEKNKPVYSQYDQPEDNIVEKPSSSFFDNYLAIGKAQMESGKQAAIKIENALKLKKKKEYEDYLKEKQRAEAQRLQDITNARKAKKVEQDHQAYLKNHKFTGETVYRHNQPFKVGTADPSKLSAFLSNEDSPVFPVQGIDEHGNSVENYMSKNELYDALHTTQSSNPHYPTTSSAQAWEKVLSKPVITQRHLNKNLKIITGDDITVGDKTYKVINPWGENTDLYNKSWKSFRDTFDNTHGSIHVRNSKGEDEFLEGEDITDAYRLDPNLVKITRGKPFLATSKDAENQSTSAPSSLNNPGNTAPPAMNDPQQETGTANQEAAARAAAVRNAAKIAQENAQRAALEQQQQPDEQKINTQPKVKIRIKTPPNNQNEVIHNPVYDGETIESVPGLAYGGSTYKYQVGNTTTQPQSATPAIASGPTVPGPSKVPGAIKRLKWGETTKKMYVIEYDANNKQVSAPYETPYTKIITSRELGINSKTKEKEWKYYAQFPDNMSSKDRAAIADESEQYGTGDKSIVVNQHGNQRLNAKNPYKHFYGNTKPQDYEDRVVRQQLGDQATDAMDEITKRKKAFEILKINDVPEGDLTDAARLYNDEDFFTKKFYPSFTAAMPQDKYRKQHKDDWMLGIEHLKGFPAAPIPPGKKLAYQCVNGQVTSSEYEGDTLPAGSFATSEEAGKNCGKTPQKPFDPKTFSNDDWWVQDRINFAGAITDPIHSYFPAMGHHDYMTPGYVLNDPTTQLRAVQQSIGSLQNQGFNSMSGNTAMAAASGLAGQGIDKAAEILGNVGNSNVGIVNNAAARNADIVNRGIDMNENDKQVYTGNMARVLNNRDKEEQFKKWRMLGALNNGITNMQRRHQYEDMYKNVTIDPVSGHRIIHGNGMPQLNDDGSFAYDPYVNPYGGGSGVAVADPDSLYKRYKESGSTHQEAVDKVNLQLRAQQIRSSGSRGRSGAQYPGGSYGSQSPYNGGGYGASADSAYGFDV